ncbi:MAG: acyltransferase family protein [Acidimicrobiia bacterium]
MTSSPPGPALAGGATGAAGRLDYHPALDGLRALAVAAVVVFHLRQTGLTGGFLGVDAFFVLSGFLITTLLVLEWRRHRGIGLLAFWGRRARRLLPALLLMMLAVAVFAAIATPTDELHRLRYDGIAGLFYAANWRFVASGQSYFDLFASPSPFRHLWSLAIEEQFYLVWPLVTLGCLTLARGRLRLLAVVAAVGAIVSTALMAGLFIGDDPSRAYYGTDTHAHPILVGVLLALVLVDRPTVSAGVARALDVTGLVALLAVLGAFAFAHDTSPRLYRGGSLAFAVAVAVVIATVMRAPRGMLGRLFAWRPFVAIGIISYGIYLWHWPVIVEVTATRTGLSGLGLELLQVAITLAISIASYLLVERPIRHGFRFRRAWLAAPAGLALGMVAILVGTAGATSAPAFLQQGPTDPNTTNTTLGPATAGDPTHVVLVGDSLAKSLGPGLDDAFARDGIPFDADAIPGCSVIRGVTVQGDGRPYPWSRACDQAITPALRAMVRNEPRPDLVLWLSTWDGVDRLLGGRRVRVDSRSGKVVLTREIRRAADLLTAEGARVMILTVPSPVPGTPTVLPGLDEAGRIRAINALYRRAAPTAAGEVRVLDLATIVCPGGRCPEHVDGVTLRPDGSHFGVEGAQVVGRAVANAALACWRDPNRCR